jgi:patatin-like phospholipase/acyl hydrolase
VEQTTPIRIIAVDGGGVRGAIPARMIELLADAHPGLLARTDLFAGTSTGGLIALGLAKGLAPTQVVDMYRRDAGTIFGSSTRRWRVQWLYQAKYCSDGLRDVIGRLLGEQKLRNLAKPVFIPVTALKRPDGRHVPAGVFLSTVYRLYNEPTKERYHSGEWSCVDAAMATAAAPTYFPAHRASDPRLGGEWLLWDGGLVANNPALAAIAELARFVPVNRLSFRILSLGTGYRSIPIEAGDWGRVNAVEPLISALFDASVGSTAFYLSRGYGDDIIRVTPELPRDYNIDDAGVVEELIHLTDDYSQAHWRSVPQPDGTSPSLLDWLETHW